MNFDIIKELKKSRLQKSFIKILLLYTKPHTWGKGRGGGRRGRERKAQNIDGIIWDQNKHY